MEYILVHTRRDCTDVNDLALVELLISMQNTS